MKILFLDIDGVLNGHEYDEAAQSCLIKPSCVKHLTKVLESTGAHVVISSAWRYIVSRGAMSLRGFEYLLRSHGVGYITNKVIGHTREDLDQTSQTERGQEISEWLQAHPEVTKYAVVDDLDLGIRGKHPFVQTESKVGLTAEKAEELIKLLGKGP